MPPLYRLLDAVRAAERVTPEARGLAELFWRYTQGFELNDGDLTRLDEIIVALQVLQFRMISPKTGI